MIVMMDTQVQVQVQIHLKVTYDQNANVCISFQKYAKVSIRRKLCKIIYQYEEINASKLAKTAK